MTVAPGAKTDTARDKCSWRLSGRAECGASSGLPMPLEATNRAEVVRMAARGRNGGCPCPATDFPEANELAERSIEHLARSIDRTRSDRWSDPAELGSNLHRLRARAVHRARMSRACTRARRVSSQ